MLARVKQDYAAGPVMAFSGREYVRSEWREVPPGFEEQAKNHPLLETQPSLKEIRAENSSKPGLGSHEPEGKAPAVTAVTAVTAEPPAESQPFEATTEDANPEPAAEEEPSEAEPSAEAPAEETEPKPARRRRRAAED